MSLHPTYKKGPILKKWTLLLFTATLLIACNKEIEKGPIYFEALSPSQTGIDFTNSLEPTSELNIIEYLYFYNGAGVAIGDLDNDGLEDVFFTGNQVQDQLYKNLGELRFSNITASAGILNSDSWSNGVTMADVNNDGLLDIYVSVVGQYKTLKGHNKLYLNKGDMQFEEVSKEVHLDFSGFGTQASFFDYDNDGDLDVYLLNHTVHTPRSYGKIDKRSEKDLLSGDRFYENTLETGVLDFKEVSAEAGIFSSPLGYGLGLATADFNKDGFIDIYIGNDFHENDYLFLNNGDKTFKEVSKQMISHSSRFTMGLDVADLNNDAQLDIFSLDMMPDQAKILLKSGGEDTDKVAQIKSNFGYQPQYSRNHLQLNNGRGAFKEIALLTQTYATDWSWSALIEDFDNDGQSDIFISNGIYRRPNDLDYINYMSNVNFGQYQQNQQDALEKKLIEEMPQLHIGNVILRNEGQMIFSKYSQEAGLNNTYSNGAAYSDLDLDGDIDLLINNINSPAQLLENTTNPQNFVGFQVSPSAEVPNTQGAKISVYSQDKVWYKEVTASRGFASASSQNIHFGLGQKNRIDSVHIEYLGGKKQRFTNLKANQYHKIDSQTAQSTQIKPQIIYEATESFPFTHTENTYYDYEREPLMLEKLSIEGPAYVFEDFDGDGLKDLYLGAAKYQESSYFKQNENHSFSRIPSEAFLEDALYEDVDAAAIDYDNDGDLDLYVMSGGNDSPEGDIQLADRLYINNGLGQFTRSAAVLPKSNGGSISVADFNNDGYDDLFLGSRSMPGAYGVAPYSVILKNTQKGNFELLDRVEFGMITDSAWGDLNSDGFLDLVLVGDFMPVTVLMNQQGVRFENQTTALGLEHSSGLWNTLALEDLNRDGRLDILAGNAGLNMKLTASVEAPVVLHLADFDANGQIDPVFFYDYEGQHIPFATKDQLAGQMPLIKKKFTSYEAFSKVRSLKQLFDLIPEDTETKKIEELRSMVYLNQTSGFEGQPLPRAAQMSSIEDFHYEPVTERLYYVGNYKGYVTQLGQTTANPGGVLSEFKQGTFTQHKELPIAPFEEGRALVKLPENKLLILYNNSTAVTLNLTQLQ